MEAYLEMLRYVLKHGKKRADRTSTGTLSIFGYQFRHKLREGFPLLTTKKMNFHAIKGEVLWYLRGETSVRWLHQHGIHIWDPWAAENGELGPIYGYQWRRWPTYDGRHIDQLVRVIEEIKNNPTSRRLVVSAWNTAQIEQMRLPPCHVLFQFYVDVEERTLSCHLYQRSADLFIGVPFNIAGYALLTHMVAHVTNLQAGELIISYGDLHLYLNHLEVVEEQLSRTPRALPILRLNPQVKNIDKFTIEDIWVENYDPHPPLRAPVAI